MNTEHHKGVFGLIAIWTSWAIGHLATIQAWASVLASLAAFVASLVYSWYYLRKIRHERQSGEKFKQNGKQ